jgi:hypothetical protein
MMTHNEEHEEHEGRALRAKLAAIVGGDPVGRFIVERGTATINPEVGREVKCGGNLYRGPMPTFGAKCKFFWKINVYRHSGKMSKSGSGLRVGKSWQCLNRYTSFEAANQAMKDIERRAAG